MFKPSSMRVDLYTAACQCLSARPHPEFRKENNESTICGLAASHLPGRHELVQVTQARSTQAAMQGLNPLPRPPLGRALRGRRTRAGSLRRHNSCTRSTCRASSCLPWSSSCACSEPGHCSSHRKSGLLVSSRLFHRAGGNRWHKSLAGADNPASPRHLRYTRRNLSRSTAQCARRSGSSDLCMTTHR